LSFLSFLLSFYNSSDLIYYTYPDLMDQAVLLLVLSLVLVLECNTVVKLSSVSLQAVRVPNFFAILHLPECKP